jgi:hypothetical protein
MTVARNMLKELVERKLWPVALVLIVALVAVPVLLTKKAPTDLVTPPTGPLPYSSGTALPAISVKSSPGDTKLAGNGHNPFAPQHVATTSTTTTATAASVSSTGSAGAASSSTGSTSVNVGGGSTSTATAPTTPTTPATTPTPTPTTPAPTPTPTPTKPAPTGLTATESYHVSLALTNADGSLRTIDPLERLSILPGKQQPMLVELGVLQGGRRVLFLVEPGTVVSGAGTCTPGPIDCEILSLAPGQQEGLSKQSSTGGSPTAVALFSVNSISADQHPSVAAANKARQDASDVGRELLANSPLSALSLFQYDPSVGAVVDLRNLTVGGS